MIKKITQNYCVLSNIYSFESLRLNLQLQFYQILNIYYK